VPLTVLVNRRHRLGREERKTATALKATLLDQITVPDVADRPLMAARIHHSSFKFFYDTLASYSQSSRAFLGNTGPGI
jgi:hypothetical protein